MKLSIKIFLPIILISALLILLNGCFLAPSEEQPAVTLVTLYTVTYDGNENTGGVVPTDAASPYKEGDKVKVLGNTGELVNTGNLFYGWNTAADATGDPRPVGYEFYMGTSDVTLYAMWDTDPGYGGPPTVPEAAYSPGPDVAITPTPAPVVVTEIAVEIEPTKVTYTEGDLLELAGLVVTLTKSDASEEDVAFAGFAAAGITTVKADGEALDVADIEVVITHTASGQTANQAITVNAVPLAVGDSYGGGKVAYIFEEEDDGYVEGEQHGLIAAIDDATTRMEWSNIDHHEIGSSAQGIAIGTGQANTTAIVAQTEHGGYVTCTSGAAYYCDDLEEGGFSDWFLPSKYELGILYGNKDVIGGFTDSGTSTSYWSSTEYAYNLAWKMKFSDGSFDMRYKWREYRVRAVRTF